MSEFAQLLLIALVPGLVISIVSAYLASRWTIRHFYSEKWWDLKAEAYSKLMTCLVDLQYCFGRWLDDIEGVKELPDEEKGRLSRESMQAVEQLTKAEAAGSFAVSDKAAAAIEALVQTLTARYQNPNPYRDWTDLVGEAHEQYLAVKQCIADVRRYAAEDLHKH